MADYTLGTEITIFETFTLDDVPTNPTVVVAQVERPNGTVDEFTFGVDAELTNPSPGYYELAYLPPSSGTYNWRWEGTGAVVASSEGSFTVSASALGEERLDTGPCEPWVTAEDVADYCEATFTGGTDTSVLEPYAAVAGDVFFELSGRVYTGECGPITARPCADECGCWAIAAHRGVAGWAWDPAAGRWACAGRSCGCSPTSEVQLAGYPRQIVEVRIDGVPLEDWEYRLDPRGRLVRMRDPAEPNTRLTWPACQIIDLPDTEEGTFAIDYTHGLDPPDAGREAAMALACQMWSARNNSGRCKLPQNTKSIVRGGLTLQIGGLIAASLKEGATGILAIDSFIAAHGDDGNVPSVWSPDLPPYPRRVGPTTSWPT
jgi:hypothetical protein